MKLVDHHYEAGTVQPRHRHDQSSLTVVLSGEVVEETALDVCSAGAGMLISKPAGYWHADVYGPRGLTVVQILPADEDQDRRTSAVQYGAVDAPRVAKAVIALFAGGRSETVDAELWDALDPLVGVQADEQLERAPSWWPDAVSLLDDCTRQPVMVSDVAGRIGVHPVHLARVVRRQFGCTVRQYIRQRRVLAAWRAWDRDEDSLAAIATRVGFSDQAHMTRAFASVLGTSPGRLRHLVSRES